MKNGRHGLPWRQIYDLPTRDRLYRVWIAEVMLQQTQVDRVIPYYTRFLERYPSIDTLATTTYDELFPYYQGLGYYSRARRMITLAREVVTRYDGIFPSDFGKLRQLPGIGEYTANALLAFGYDQPVLAMDANLKKVFSRYYFGDKNIQKHTKKISYAPLIKGDKRGLKKYSGRSVNNALMDFGALVSTSFAKIDSETYPLQDCVWFKTQGKLEIQSMKNEEGRMKKMKNEGNFLVFLHENHKKYYSSKNDGYEPFLIHSSAGVDRRHSIQEYFSTTYGLEVSVRPSFGSGEYEDIFVQLFHAQIQTGQVKFAEYDRNIKQRWIDDKKVLINEVNEEGRKGRMVDF